MCALVTGVQTCALPISTDAPQTWSWMGEFTGRLMGPYFPYLENEEPQSIKFIDMTFGIQGAGFVSISSDGGISGWFIEPPIFGESARSEEHTSELQSLMRISYADFCLKTKTTYLHSLTRSIYHKQ